MIRDLVKTESRNGFFTRNSSILPAGIFTVLLFLLIPGILSAQGQPTADGFPSERERALLVLVNAARQSPQAWCTICSDECGSYPSSALDILVYDARLGRASRFHSQHLHDTPCFQADSCCVLEPAGNTVQCATPPAATCTECESSGAACPGTEWTDRVEMFGPDPSGMLLGAGVASAQGVLCQWFTSAGATARDIVFGEHVSAGAGHFRGSECYRNYWNLKFSNTPAPKPIIPAGSRIDATWYAVNYFPPSPGVQTAVVVENGVCNNLTLEWGTQSSGTWTYRPATADTGCHTYWFYFKGNDNSTHFYPSQGALGFGDAGCPEYVPNRPSANCINPECSEGETRDCYDGPAGTEDVGECRGGTQTCTNGLWGNCEGQVVPGPELCDGKDHSCNGIIDDGCPVDPDPDCIDGETRPCYEGPPGTQNVGECRAGIQTCTDGSWGDCEGQVLPGTELCDGKDHSCNGIIDDGCNEDPDSGCIDGETRPCYEGPPGTQNVGECRAGIQTCTDGSWGDCEGQVLPGTELCDGRDHNCNGIIDDGCNGGNGNGGTNGNGGGVNGNGGGSNGNGGDTGDDPDYSPGCVCSQGLSSDSRVPPFGAILFILFMLTAYRMRFSGRIKVGT